MDAVILGVSKDSLKSHVKFIEKVGIPFVLLSDEAGTMLEDYGVFVEKKMYGKTYMGIQRSTFLIDPSGIIRKIYPKPNTKTHAEEVLADLRALRA